MEETPLRAEDQFHVGIVVEDLDATRAELSAAFGYQWCAEIGGPTQVELATGAALLEFSCSYSTTLPRLEIVRRIPGTLWEPATDSGIHHVGYWSDDVAADSTDLERCGYVAEATRRGPDGVPSFAFYRGPTGLRVELVSRGSQPDLERYWSSQAQPASGQAQPASSQARPTSGQAQAAEGRRP